MKLTRYTTHTFIFLAFSLLLVANAIAQNCAAPANYWYFGSNAGMRFDGGAPTTLTNGLVNNYEGSATMSDDSGNLLFYTDGTLVWNRNHQQMPNGFGLLGDPSTTQTALIIPQPNNANSYYVFTAPSQGAAPEQSPAGVGINYSVVDMNLDGGLGDVVLKNQPLINPAAEKLTAARHANGCDIWIIAHGMNSNRFVAYLLTSTGLNTTPVNSFVGDSYSPLPADEEYLGYLKASPDGSMIANAKYSDAIEVFNFNRATGALSVLHSIPQGGQPNSWAYGVEFSPDGSRLYAAYGTGVLNTPCLFQWDLTAANTAAVVASQTTLFTYNPNVNGIDAPKALQMAPDGKIYVAINGSGVGVIGDPNALGLACNFLPVGVALPPGTGCGNGLPNFAPYLFAPQLPVIDGAINVCANDPQTYTATVNCQAAQLEWIYNGTASIVGTTNNSITLNFGQLGTETLIVRQTNCGTTYDTLQINVNPCEPISCDVGFGWTATDTVVCVGQSAIAHFQAAANVSASLTNLSTATTTNLTPAQYNLNFANVQQSTCFALQLATAQCDTTIQFCITANPPLTFAWTAIDTIVCQGDATQIGFTTNATNVQLTHLNNGTIRTNPSLPISILNIQADSCYSLYLSNGCDTSINFCIHRQGVIDNITQVLSVCEGESVAVGNNIYTQTGVYTDVLTNATGCDSTIVTTLTVNESWEQNNTVQICIGETVTVGNNTYFQTGVYQDVLSTQAGCDSTIITNLSVNEYLTRSQAFTMCNTDSMLVYDRYLSGAGVYADTLLFVSACDSIVTTTIYTKACDTLNVSSCRLLIPNAFSPNNDTRHDDFGILAPCNDLRELHLSIYNRWGELVFETRDYLDRWDGTCHAQACEMGVYAWVATYEQQQQDNWRAKVSRGNVTLLR